MNDRAEIRQREEHAGNADDIVMQEIARAAVKLVDIDLPAVHWNRQADIVLDVALAAQRNEAITLNFGAPLGKAAWHRAAAETHTPGSEKRETGKAGRPMGVRVWAGSG